MKKGAWLGSTLCEGADGASWSQFALQKALLRCCGNLVHQLSILCVRVHGQQLLLGDQVGGLTNMRQKFPSASLLSLSKCLKHVHLLPCIYLLNIYHQLSSDGFITDPHLSQREAVSLSITTANKRSSKFSTEHLPTVLQLASSPEHLQRSALSSKLQLYPLDSVLDFL